MKGYDFRDGQPVLFDVPRIYRETIEHAPGIPLAEPEDSEGQMQLPL
jgi:hypothetical protein